MRPEKLPNLWITCLYIIDTLCTRSPLEHGAPQGFRKISPSRPPDTHMF
jgi:hypothetical protein